MDKFILLARFWNDSEWMDAALEHIDYWGADEIYICEGNWDKKFPARSIDDTLEKINSWAEGKLNVHIVENLRDDDNYRVNQAETSNLVMKLANIESGDWMMIVDCDHFYFKDDIDAYKECMERCVFTYPKFKVYNFLDGINRYYEREDKNSSKLPYRVINGAKWIPTNHLAIDGKMYESLNITFLPTTITGYHYPLARTKKRLKDKYNIGDRESPIKWNNGKMMKNLDEYNGEHPEFVIETLTSLGYING